MFTDTLMGQGTSARSSGSELRHTRQTIQTRDSDATIAGPANMSAVPPESVLGEIQRAIPTAFQTPGMNKVKGTPMQGKQIGGDGARQERVTEQDEQQREMLEEGEEHEGSPTTAVSRICTPARATCSSTGRGRLGNGITNRWRRSGRDGIEGYRSKGGKSTDK